MSSLSVHEKFLPYTISFNKKVDELCDSACDSEKNYTRYCPSECISVCPKYCQNIMPMPERTSIHVNIGHHHEASHLLIAMLSLAGATLLVIFLYFAYVRVQNSRRLPRVFQRSEESEDVFFDGEDQRDDVVEVDHPIWYIRTIGLQPCVINSIMVFKYKRSDGLIDGTECSVCLAEFEEDETLRLLPKCSHAFHVPCIDTWLSSHTNCPMCRAPIVVNSASRGVLAVEQDSGNEIPTGEEESNGSNRYVESREEEMRIGIVGGEELGTDDERERNEVDEIQPVRRSISLDSLDASKIGQSFSNVKLVRSGKIPCSRIEEFNCKSSGVDLKRVGSSSSGRSLQNGHSFMRLLSLSSQKLQSKYSRSQSSVLPL